jgi:hypothetical protein
VLDVPQNAEWTMYEICGLARDVSLAKVGELDSETLASLQAEDLSVSDMGWPPQLHREDRELAERYGFDAKACIYDEEEGCYTPFVLLGTPEDTDPFRNALLKLFPALEPREVDISSFHAHFAHIHRDKHMPMSRGQLMIILDNSAGHRLLSVDDRGKHHVLTPSAGDVAFLDVHQKHAVLPDQSKGIEHMRENPIKAVVLHLVRRD